MAIQLSSARTSLQNVLKDISDVGSSVFIEWCQFLMDSVYRDLIAVDPERFITETTINVSPNVSTYALSTVASDFKTLQPMQCGLFKQDSNGNGTTNKIPPSKFGSSVEGYYIHQGNLVLTPIPQEAKTLTFRYIPQTHTFTAVSEYFTLDGTASGIEVIPDEYRRYVVRALTVLYTIWDEDLGMEAYADARFVRVLDEMLSDIKRAPHVYELPDYTLSF